MKITSDKTNFTSRMNLNLSSVKEFMPAQEQNLLVALFRLTKNGHNNDVFIKAVSPDALKLEIKEVDDSLKTTNVVDIRKMFSLFKHEFTENFYEKTQGTIDPEVHNELVSNFENEIESINSHPVNLGEMIVAEYKKLCPQTEKCEKVIS